jgi:hypothetical protein
MVKEGTSMVNGDAVFVQYLFLQIMKKVISVLVVNLNSEQALGK